MCSLVGYVGFTSVARLNMNLITGSMSIHLAIMCSLVGYVGFTSVARLNMNLITGSMSISCFCLPFLSLPCPEICYHQCTSE